MCLGHSGVTLGACWGPAGPPRRQTDGPRSGRAEPGRGWGGRRWGGGAEVGGRRWGWWAGPSWSRGQSGAGGVSAGPMAAREWALLSDRVMGRAARRSLTPAEGAPGGVTAGHRSTARPLSQTSRPGARARLPEPRPGRGTDTNRPGANKGPPHPGRGTARARGHSPPRARTRPTEAQALRCTHFPAHMVTELTKRPRLPDQKETGGPFTGHLRESPGWSSPSPGGHAPMGPQVGSL